MGNPPTGGRIAVPGAAFLTVAGGAVHSVKDYWDQKTFVEQLGLQAIVLPVKLGSLAFGYSSRMSAGKLTKPGAFSLTWLQARSLEEEIAVRTFVAEKVIPELAALPGCLGLTLPAIEGWMSTITAWEHPEDAGRVMGLPAHREGVRWLMLPDAEGGVSARGVTSVWSTHHVNSMWERCVTCGHMVDVDHAAGVCPTCGAASVQTTPYW